ncbi:hypothetical protein N2152v2_009735 [Parachlorella kessleri]
MGDRYNGDDYRSPRTYPPRPDVNKTIYVGNLRYDTEEKTVHDWFEKYYGPVSHVKMIYDKETGRSKGFCFVSFEDEQDATEALNDSNGRDLDGGIIRVNHARGPPSFPPGRRSFDGPPRGRGGYVGGRGDGYGSGGRSGGGYGRGGYGGRGGYQHYGEGGGGRGGEYAEERDRERYSPRRSRSPPRGGKHDRDHRDDDYYDEEGGAPKGAEGGTKRRRRASPSPSKSRSSGERSPSYSSGSPSESSAGEEHRAERERGTADKAKGGSAKQPPSSEAVKKEMMRLRKAEAELTFRVKALENELKAGKASREKLEAQLESQQEEAAGQLKTKEETIRKYRQWLGALLECTTKLSAGRAAAAAAEAEVKQREGDLALLNEEVAAFMSKARWVLTMMRVLERLIRDTQRSADLALLNEEVTAFMSKARWVMTKDSVEQLKKDLYCWSDLALLNAEVAAFMSKAREERLSSRRARREERSAAAATPAPAEGEEDGQQHLDYDEMVHSYEQAAAEAEHHGTDEAQLAEAMQYAVDEDGAAAAAAGEAPEGGWGNTKEGAAGNATPGHAGTNDVAAKFAPGIKFKLQVYEEHLKQLDLSGARRQHQDKMNAKGGSRVAFIWLSKKAFIAGVADDQGYAWAIAKCLAEAGAEIALGVWPPALSIFQTSMRQGKFDGSRKLLDGRMMEFAKIMPMDAVFDRREDVPEEVASNKRYAGITGWTVSETAEKVRSEWGRIDVLVHSLANGPEVKKPLLETSRAGYLAAVSASAYSLVSMMQHFGPNMNEGGAVVSMTYQAADRVIPGYGGGMSSAKAALQSDTRVLAYEAGRKWGVRVNTISAGPLGSRAAKAIGFIDDMINYSHANAPIHKEMRAMEVGALAAFLCSPLASAVTGHVCWCDNGLSVMGLATDSKTLEKEFGEMEKGAPHQATAT